MIRITTSTSISVGDDDFIRLAPIFLARGAGATVAVPAQPRHNLGTQNDPQEGQEAPRHRPRGEGDSQRWLTKIYRGEHLRGRSTDPGVTGVTTGVTLVSVLTPALTPGASPRDRRTPLTTRPQQIQAVLPSRRPDSNRGPLHYE
jgi:hypothetical protein